MLTINRLRAYFLYGAPPYQDIVQFTHQGFDEGERYTNHVIDGISDFAANEEFKASFEQAYGDQVVKFDVYDRDWHNIPKVDTYPQYWIPNFFTIHYRMHHRPYYIDCDDRDVILTKAHLNGTNLFRSYPLQHDIRLVWDFVIGMETCPIIYLMIEVDGDVDSEIAYRLNSLHLVRESFIPSDLYPDITMEPSIAESLKEREDNQITLHELARSIQYTLYKKAGLSETLASTPLEAIVHLPFTAIEVNGEYESQSAFVDQHCSEITRLISRPAIYEFDDTSQIHREVVLENDRVWSVAQDTFFVMAYSGALYIKLNCFNTFPMLAVSNYRLADEHAVFHSFRLAVANYYILRLVDAELDEALERIKKQIDDNRNKLKELYNNHQTDDIQTVSNLNDLVIHVSDLRFKFLDLLEELDNADKLIDEEWHIDLLNKINKALGMHDWRNSIKSRLENLHEVVHVLETSYERFLNLNASIESRDAERRAVYLTFIFSAFAGAEVLGLLLNVALAPDDNMFKWVKHVLPTWFGMQAPMSDFNSHLIASILVLVAIICLAILSYFLARSLYLVAQFIKNLRQP